MMKLKKLNYVPVLNGTVLNCTLRDDIMIDGKRATFITKDSIFKYNTFLINPFHHDELFIRIKNKGDLLPNSIILSDSGGLQEITLGEKKFTPKEVFLWQQEHSHIGFCVDSIPYITKNPDGTNKPGSFSGWIFKTKEFLDHARLTKKNIDDTKPYRDRKKDFAFYGIVQGRKYQEFLDWYNIIKDDNYLDGYCVKASNNNPINLAEVCVFAIHNVVKPLHFLGTGNMSRAIIVCYANKHLKQPITFDSSSYDIGAQYRSYLLPFMMNRKVRFVSNHNMGEFNELTSANDIVHIKDASLICDCPVCQTMGDRLGKMIETNDPVLGGLLSVHNLIMNIRWLNYVQAIIDIPYKLNEFVKYSFEPHLAEKILKGFDMIDISVKKGPEYALHKYKNDIQLNKETGSQKGVFDF